MSWVDTIRSNLHERDVVEKQHAQLIEQFNRLAALAVTLKQRNSALLHASTNSTISTNTSHSKAASSSKGGEPNAVQQAFLDSLQAELTKTRSELSEQYKQSSMLSQRLVSASDSLHSLQGKERQEKDELRKLRNEVENLRDKARWHKEVLAQKDQLLLAVQDETASLNLELSQLDQKCENLQTDNAELLSRWIEAKQEMADAVNEMNDLANQNKLAKLESQLKQATVHGEDGHTVQGGSDGKGASEQRAPPGEA